MLSLRADIVKSVSHSVFIADYIEQAYDVLYHTVE